MTYKLYVRDANLNKIGEIDDFQNLTAALKFNDVGAWSLQLSTKVARDKGLMGFDSGIVIERDGQTILSGPVINPNRKWDINGDVTTIAGVDDNVWLQRRLAYPVPTGPPYTTQANDMRSGAAETVMRQYVDVNLGPSALSQRSLSGLTLANDLARGNSGTWSARFDNLLTLLQGIALAGGDLGFRIVQVNNGLQFQVYQPADKTTTAIFSPLLGNLKDFQLNQVAASANYVIVGGSGQGTARTFIEQGDSASITQYGRIEDFQDRRDTNDATQMQSTIDQELSANAQQTSLTITPIDTDGLSFENGYGLGDKVTVVITVEEDVVDIQQVKYFLQSSMQSKKAIETIRQTYPTVDVIQDVVRSINIQLNTTNGEVITPAVGTPESLRAGVPKLFRDLRRIKTRVLNLERRT